MNDGAHQNPAIQVKGLSKAFGRASVLRNLDLEVPWRQVLAVVGPNGSGKTTLIGILATLIRPDVGTVSIAGLSLSQQGRQIRRVIGVVTHDPLLYDELTGYENLSFHGRMFGLDRLDQRIVSVADRLGVTARLGQRVATLSHGLRKRFSIARALLHDPPVLLMDEPEAGLDQEAVSMLEGVVRDPTRPYRTVLMTTHNLEMGLSLGDRLAILSEGGIAYHEPGPADTAASVRASYLRDTGGRS